jgi:hypothetical protein
MKPLLLILGSLSALLAVAQLVMGLLIKNGRADLKSIHQHSGETMVLIVLLYIGLSLTAILSAKRREDR